MANDKQLSKLIVGALTALAAACGPTRAEARSPAPGPASALQDEVFYQVMVRSFRDSNGDRQGDLPGVTQKLGYLKRLGITSLLLLPLYPSPFYHNYFADTFEGVDPELGSARDLQMLIREAHRRGMKVYVDQEIHYVTGRHAWFQSSHGHPSSPFSDFLVYDGPGNTNPLGGIFNLIELPTWTGEKIPHYSVNLRSPRVRAYFAKFFSTWLDPNADGRFDDGVDGFRIDHMMDDLDGKGRLTGLFDGFWSPLFISLRKQNPNIRFVAEQADWGTGKDWLTRGKVDAVYAFPIFRAAASLRKDKLVAALKETEAATPEGKSQLIFIENHDTDRFASETGGSLPKQKIGAALTVLLRGTPLLYSGQEIGMKGRRTQAWASDANDIPVREAFRWTRDLDAPGSAIWYAGDQPWWRGRFNRSGDGISVEEQASTPASLLSYYQSLLLLRAGRVELRAGSQRILCADHATLLCLLREQGSRKTLILANLGDSLAHASFEATLPGQAWTDAIEGGRVRAVAGLDLAPWKVRVLTSE